MSAELPERIRKKLRNYPEFFQKIWLACYNVPAGETVSYSELARRAGYPGAARAAGTALSKNPFAPVIPCHRVLRKDGKPGGYSGPGGVKAKLEMLKREKR